MNKERPQQVYILSPVRHATPDQKIIIKAHVEKITRNGDRVFNPVDDAPQDDPTGYNIVMTELTALHKAAQDGGGVDVLWNLGGTPSEGSRVDLGMVVALGLEYRLVKEFNEKDPTGPQIAYQIISKVSGPTEEMQRTYTNMLQEGTVVIDWDIEMKDERQEWQRIQLGLALGCLAHDPNFKIQLGELRGEDDPNKKSYPKVIREIERRQKQSVGNL